MSEIGTGKVVLIVEDDEHIRATLQEALESDGYSVVTATNGKEALDALQKLPRADVILLDLMMPVV
jgi:CheY-like chemotaxis protein